MYVIQHRLPKYLRKRRLLSKYHTPAQLDQQHSTTFFDSFTNPTGESSEVNRLKLELYLVMVRGLIYQEAPTRVWQRGELDLASQLKSSDQQISSTMMSRPELILTRKDQKVLLQLKHHYPCSDSLPICGSPFSDCPLLCCSRTAPEVSEKESSYASRFYCWFLKSFKSCLLLLVALPNLLDTLPQLLA